MADTLIEILSELSSKRALVISLAELASNLAKKGKNQGILLLINPKMTKERIKMEFRLFLHILHPEIREMLKIVIADHGSYEGLLETLEPEIEQIVNEKVKRTVSLKQSEHDIRLLKPDSYSIVFQILVLNWMKDRGPVTSKWLMEKAGCTFPTVAVALRRLGQEIRRYSDRRVELSHFPKHEWASLVAISDRVRSTMHFADRSGRQRSSDDLIRRLKRLHRNDIAIGGTYGARYHFPDLDLYGNPRVDISVHALGKSINLRFVEDLDPALQKIERGYESPKLVLHVMQRKESFFETGPDGIHWVDPVECLLDLHVAHLESQALEFLNYLDSQRRKKA